MLFNTKEVWTFKELMSETGLEEIELKRTLTSLSLGTFRVLNKVDQKNEIGTEDVFNWRKEFTAKGRNITINAVQMKETPQEQTKTQENVFKDRQYQVDAAVVRIMKTRKTLTQPQLTTELIGMLKFPMKMQDLKKRIDSLVEREFLERDSADANLLHYMA